jgi:hypothetical protein
MISSAIQAMPKKAVDYSGPAKKRPIYKIKILIFHLWKNFIAKTRTSSQIY